jgi:AcrR family transcriptional regulator
VPTSEGKRLPSGRHGIPTDLVRHHQRQRLIDAMAESCAASGYASTSVGDLVKSAAVSKKTFYQLFESKENCLLVSHETYCDRLYAAIDQACTTEEGWPASGREALRSALSFLAEDLAAAQLLTNTVGSAGAASSERYHAMIDTLAQRLRAAAPPIAYPFPEAEWGAVAFMSAMVSRSASSGKAGRVLALEDDFAALLLTLTHSG